LTAWSEAKPQRALSWSTFLSTYLPALVLALGTGISLPGLPALAQSFGVAFGLASGVITAFLLGNVTGTIPSGWLIDRFGRRPVLVAGPALSAAIAFLVAGAHSFPELLALRFLNGVAAQMWIMARLAAISVEAEPGQRGRLVNWMFAMDNTGRLAGPLAGGFIAAAWGFRAPFLAYGILAILALLAAVAFSQGERKDDRRLRIARQVRSPLPLLRHVVAPRSSYFAVAVFAGLTRGPVQADLLHLYAAFAYHLGPRQIGYLATSAAALSWPIGFLAGWMLDRFGRKCTTVPGFAGTALAMAALGASAFLRLSLTWYVVLFLFAVSLIALTSGSIQTIGVDVAPPESRGMFLGLWRFAGQGGAASSPIFFAALAAQVNYGSAFLFIAASAAVVAFLLVRYIPENDCRGSVSPVG
jgi:MFS family permease